MGLALTLAYTGVVLALTLSPGEADPSYWLSGCLICGAVGTADAVKNVVFFVPLGAFLAMTLRGSLWAALPAGFLSMLVEGLQFFLPGRDASPGDLLFNTLGAVLGVLLVRTSGAWLTRGRPAPVLASAWAIIITALLLFGGWMQQPSIQVGSFSQQWTPQPNGLEPYAGRVLEAWVGPHPFVDDDTEPDRELDPVLLTEALLEGQPIRMVLEVGQHRPHQAAILRAQDREKNRIFQVGARGWDLLVGVRTTTSDARLFEHDQRIRGALEGLAMGDTASVLVERLGDSFCASVDGVSVGCGGPPSIGGIWRWLEPRLERPLGRRAMGALTLFCLFLPLGFWGWGWRGMPLLVVWTGAALLLVPMTTGLGASPWWEWLAAGLGVLAGLPLRGSLEAGRASAAGQVSRRT